MTDPFLDLAEQNVARLNAERVKRNTDEWLAGNRLWRTIMLSPAREIADALLRGERVPFNRLDPLWARRFGLKQEAA